MDNWKPYLFSFITCAFICRMITQIISDSKRKALLRIITGIILAISLLYPLSKLDLNDLMIFAFPDQSCADYYISEGENTVSELRKSIITDACEAYILDRANELGAEITVRVSLDEDLIPVCAEIYSTADPEFQLQLQEILTADMGIPKENQSWIWFLESNSS